MYQSQIRLAGPGKVAAVVCLVLSLGACTTAQVESSSEVAAADNVDIQPEPELTLNLPADPDCACALGGSETSNFLEKGLESLTRGDHIEAVSYFQSYQRVESSAAADWQAAVAIAFDSMLPQSPFYDPRAANSAYWTLKDIEVDESKVHPRILIMRDALATFSGLQSQLAKLKRDNTQLTEDLAKREEALKRLRELTLGQ
jgi:hypothetical protein